MNKSVKIGLAVAAAVALCAGYNCSRGTGKKIWTKNVVSGSIPSGEINEKTGTMPDYAEIHIDASGSMKPYFNTSDPTFANSISAINNLNPEKTSIYFIGKKEPYKGLVANIVSDVKNQPALSSTTFHGFFKEAAQKLDTVNTVIYLVTDGIMSVNGTDMNAALLQLQGKITGELKKHGNLAAAIFRYEGGYDGDYWNCHDQRLSKQSKEMAGISRRPYYVIALGSKETMRWLAKSPRKNWNNTDALFMGIHDLAGHRKGVLSLGDETPIEAMNKDVTLVFDLPECLRSADLTGAVLTNDGKDIGVKPRMTERGDRLEAVIPKGTILTPESDGRIRITLTVPDDVKGKWLTEWNSEDDTAGPDQTSTYGLKYLVDGMFDGLEGDGDELSLLNMDFVYKMK